MEESSEDCDDCSLVCGPVDSSLDVEFVLPQAASVTNSAQLRIIAKNFFILSNPFLFH